MTTSLVGETAAIHPRQALTVPARPTLDPEPGRGSDASQDMTDVCFSMAPDDVLSSGLKLLFDQLL
ncbi:hypothetical protein [Paraburkholderia solisilvae]|uniref:Uncharacterized protein n=1 Tax=Paraburkholderia solisilvae TaxID=624376 RepID=A0A6J5EFE3_9BURK|nr:hypothetical protein [Paraburkholderia solisilvae]CAB3765268.1 hypothetical protein LMG29739_04543 [Paraburkholderia solisilvae]